MEAKLLIQSRSPFSTPLSRRRHKREPECRPIVAVLTRLPDNIPTAANEKQRISVYRDNWFDQMAINYLSRSLQVTTGCRNSKTGYDSLVEAATMVFRNFDGDQQREVVVHALHRAFPSLILSMIRALLPQSKFTREYFAAFTTVFFAWLVGPSEVRESELNGRREKNVVYINKCRFLEQTNCVGMCTNLCKMPSQAFIKDSLGMPVNMVPNFDDMSCEMIFGQDPPAPTDDPAFKQPCYKLCNSKANQKHNFKCSS